MGSYNKISRSVILPASDLFLGNSISDKLNFLDKSQWWSRGELDEFQNERLRLLIRHAYENVPFYKERFNKIKLKPDDIKKKEDLIKLPVIKKFELRQAFPNNTFAQNIKIKDCIAGITSGSTGEPFQYFQTRESFSFYYAAGIRAWSWMGYKLGDKYAKLSQNPRKGFIKKAQDILNRSGYFFIEHLSEDQYDKVINELIKFSPQYIRCYPDPLLFLAKYIKKKGIINISPKAINSTGNILYPEAREIIEKSFQSPVYDSYSCEGGVNVSQSPCRKAYLSSMECAISEYLDDDNDEVEMDVPGRLIVTDLWNFANPFIRYDTQDILVKTKTKPQCGRELEAVSGIFGRDSDILVTPDGRLVIVHIFTIFFEWEKNVNQFQAIQHSTSEYEILLKVNKNFNNQDFNRIQKYWQEYFGINAKVEINLVDHIPTTSSGKRKFLIRNKNITLPI